MPLPPLPHSADFSFCNHFKGPITEHLEAVYQPFETPFLFDLSPPSSKETRPTLLSQRALVLQIKNTPSQVQIKHVLGLCPSLAYGKDTVLLTEAIFSAPVRCKHKNGQVSSWQYCQASVSLHTVAPEGESHRHSMSPTAQAELNEDLLLRELGYDLLALGHPQAVERLLSLMHQPEHCTKLYDLPETPDTASPSASPLRSSLNDTYLWESLLLTKEGHPILAQSMLEHFCHRSFHLLKLTTHQLIQHLQECLKSSPASFPCHRCFIAFTALGYPNLSKPEDLFLEYA